MATRKSARSRGRAPTPPTPRSRSLARRQANPRARRARGTAGAPRTLPAARRGDWPRLHRAAAWERSERGAARTARTRRAWSRRARRCATRDRATSDPQPRLERPRKGEEARGGPRRERERQVERDERIGQRHDRHRQPERAHSIGPAAEGPGGERRGHHPGGAHRRASRACQVGVEPYRRDPRERDQPPDLGARRHLLDPRKNGLERAQRDGRDEHEMHSGDGQEMGQAARAESQVVVGREIALAEHEGACHGRERRLEGRVDARSDASPHPVDVGRDACSPVRHPHIEGPARPEDPSARVAGPRIAGRLVPEALRRGERRDDVDLVSAGEVGRPSVQRGHAGPRGGAFGARDATKLGIPAEAAADFHGRGAHLRRAGASRGERQSFVCARPLRLVPGDGPTGPPRARPQGHRGDERQTQARSTRQRGEAEGARRGEPHLPRRERQDATREQPGAAEDRRHR